MVANLLVKVVDTQKWYIDFETVSSSKAEWILFLVTFDPVWLCPGCPSRAAHLKSVRAVWAAPEPEFRLLCETAAPNGRLSFHTPTRLSGISLVIFARQQKISYFLTAVTLQCYTANIKNKVKKAQNIYPGRSVQTSNFPSLQNRRGRPVWQSVTSKLQCASQNRGPVSTTVPKVTLLRGILLFLQSRGLSCISWHVRHLCKNTTKEPRQSQVKILVLPASPYVWKVRICCAAPLMILSQYTHRPSYQHKATESKSPFRVLLTDPQEVCGWAPVAFQHRDNPIALTADLTSSTQTLREERSNNFRCPRGILLQWVPSPFLICFPLLHL